MTTVGDVGIDSSGAKLSADSIHRNGGRFRIRYSAGAASEPTHPSHASVEWKLCGPNEIAEAVSAGIDFIANDEWYATRMTEGAAAGAADGAAALRFWRSRGLARGASIYCSWDANPSRLKWAKVLAYLAAFDRALKGYYHVDCYAGTPFLKYALSKGTIWHGWRPNAGSWSNDGLPYQPRLTPTLLGQARAKTPAAIWQTGNYWYGKQADENVILRSPAGTHLEASTPKPEPTPAPDPAAPIPPVSEEEMLIVSVDKVACATARVRWPGVFLLTGSHLTHIPHSSDVTALTKAGVKNATISLDMYRRLGGK